MSAASIWEISIQCALGKLEADPNEVLAAVEPAGFNHLPVLGSPAAKVMALPPPHKDPFDRLLIAQARVEPLILLTDDAQLGDYGDLVDLVLPTHQRRAGGPSSRHVPRPRIPPLGGPRPHPRDHWSRVTAATNGSDPSRAAQKRRKAPRANRA